MPHPAVRSPLAEREGKLGCATFPVPFLRSAPSWSGAEPALRHPALLQNPPCRNRRAQSFPPAPELLGMEAQEEPGACGDTGDTHGGHCHSTEQTRGAASAAAAGGFGSEPRGKIQTQTLAPPKICPRRPFPARVLCPVPGRGSAASATESRSTHEHGRVNLGSAGILPLARGSQHTRRARTAPPTGASPFCRRDKPCPSPGACLRIGSRSEDGI